MENKIQKLTEQLYNDGVAKGKEQSDQLIADSKQQAAAILAKANEEADAIISKAKSDATELNDRSLSDVKRSSKESIADVKSQLQKAIISKAISSDLKSAFADDSFIKELILASVNAWGGSNGGAITVTVAEGSEDSTDKYIKSKVDQALASSISVEGSVELKEGFTITPEGEGYYIKFTSEDFELLISQYVRAKVAEIVFGA